MKMGRRICPSCSKTASLISMIGLTTSFFLVEVIVGYITNSMALVADSFHMLSDVVSLFVGYFALRYSKRNKSTDRNTFGWQRAEVLGALVNAVFLIALCFSILVESLKRIAQPEGIEDPVLVLIAGGAGLLVNIIGLFIFHQHGHGHSHGGGGSHGHNHGHGHSHNSQQTQHRNELAVLRDRPSMNRTESSTSKDGVRIQEFNTVFSDSIMSECQDLQELGTIHDKSPMNAGGNTQLNMRGVYLHVLGDALGSIVVVISALIIMYAHGDWTLYVDPSMSILMVMLILKTSIPLLKESSLILLQTVPTHIKIKEVQDRLLEKIEGVLSVHEFHVWQLAGDKIIASAHIRCRSLNDYMMIANEIKEFFHDEGIHSTTIQPEFVETSVQTDDKCVLKCGPDKNCAAQMCCGSSIEDIRKRTGSRISSLAVITEDDQASGNVEKSADNNIKEKITCV